MTTPDVPLDSYIEVKPLLRHIRVMERVMDWMDSDPRTRQFYAELRLYFLSVLQEEFAPHAITFALAIAELENAFPEIEV